MFLVAATTLIILSQVSRGVDCYNILFFTLHGSMSHFEGFRPTMEALSVRGHNVTYLTVLPVTAANVTVHFMQSLHLFLEAHRVNVLDVNEDLDDRESQKKKLRTMCLDACHVFLNDSALRAVVDDHKSGTRYDVVVVDPSLAECGLALIHLLGHPPFIYYCNTQLYTWHSGSLGILAPLSYVPMATYRDYNLRYLLERIKNVYDYYVSYLTRNYFLMPKVLTIARSVHRTLPSLQDIESNVSFILANSHPPSLDVRRPQSNHFAEVGGTQLRPAKPLPKDLEEFVNGSGKDGFIYVSLGSYVSDRDMSAERVDAFVGAFRKLKQRVVWKSARLAIANLPPNVRIFPWLSQQDLLGHPKIKVFVSQCGQLSVQEAVFHGVPILGMPVIVDQFLNAQTVDERGIGERLDFYTFDERVLYKTLMKIIHNSSYKKNCLRHSALIRDRPSSAIDTSIYWVEYVARHKGAPNLRNKGHDRAESSFFQYFGLDVAATAIFFFAIAFVLAKFVLRKLFLAIRAIFLTMTKAGYRYSRIKKRL